MGETFGDVLRELRLAAGLSQAALADQSGLSVNAVGLLERGERRRPYPDTVRRLAAALVLDEVSRQRLLEAATEPPAPPRPRTAEPPSLPLRLTAFVGRDRELGEVADLLRRNRLVTITGIGGIGKSRLAIEAARIVGQEEARVIHFAGVDQDLAPAPVRRALAARLALVPPRGGDELDAYAIAFAERSCLLVIDGCEAADDAGAVVLALLASCPQLAVLATSRRPLGLDGEVCYPAPPLSTNADAVELFLERARSAAPHLDIDEESRSVIAGICARLGGIPLALELAAAHARILPLPDLLRRADDALRLLRVAPGDTPQAAPVLASLDWTCCRLTPDQQALLARLSVCVDSFTVELAEMLADVDVVTTLAALSEMSLVVGTAVAGRLRILEPVRQYAAGRLLSSEDAAETRGRHTAYVLQLAEQVCPLLSGPEQGRWLSRLDDEAGNVQVALESLRDAHDDRLLRLTAALGPYWIRRGRTVEPRRWLDLGLERTAGPRSARLAALETAALLACLAGDFASMGRRAEQLVAEAEAYADTAAVARGTRLLGRVAAEAGDEYRARAHLDRAVELAEVAREPETLAHALNERANLLQSFGDTPQVEALRRALDAARCSGDVLVQCMVLDTLALAELLAGRYAEASDAWEEMLELDPQLTPWGRAYLAEGLARLAFHVGEPRVTIQLIAAADSVRRRTGFTGGAGWDKEVAAALRGARAAVPEAVLTPLWDDGLRLPIEHAIAVGRAVARRSVRHHGPTRQRRAATGDRSETPTRAGHHG